MFGLESMQEAEVNHETVRRPMPFVEIVGGLREKLYTKPAQFPRGNEPARASAGSVSIKIECDELFASRLAPTVDCAVLLVSYLGSLSTGRSSKPKNWSPAIGSGM